MMPLEPAFDEDTIFEQYLINIDNYKKWDGPLRRSIRLGNTNLCKSNIAAFCIGNAWKCYRLRVKVTPKTSKLQGAIARATRLAYSFSQQDVAAFCISNAWKCYRLRRLIECAKYLHSVHLTQFTIGHIQPDYYAIEKFKCKYYNKWVGQSRTSPGVRHFEAGDQIMEWLDNEHLAMIRLYSSAITVWSGIQAWYPEATETYTFPFERKKYEERIQWAEEHGESSAQYYFGDPIVPRTCKMSAKRSLRKKIYDYLKGFNKSKNLSSAITTIGGYDDCLHPLCDWETFANCCDIPDLSLFDLQVTVSELKTASVDKLDSEKPPDQSSMKELWHRLNPPEPTLDEDNIAYSSNFPIRQQWIMKRPEFTSNIGNVNKDSNGFSVEGPVFFTGSRFVKVFYEPEPVFYDISYNPNAIGQIPMKDWNTWRQSVSELFQQAPRPQKVKSTENANWSSLHPNGNGLEELQDKEASMRIKCAKYEHISVYRNAIFVLYRCKYLGEYGHGFTELKYALDEYNCNIFRQNVMKKNEKKRLAEIKKMEADVTKKKKSKKKMQQEYSVWLKKRKSLYKEEKNNKRKRLK